MNDNLNAAAISKETQSGSSLQRVVRPPRRLRGLEKICKLYGRLKCGEVTWVWDYHRDVAVPDYRMPIGGAEWKKSEKAKWSNDES